MLRKNFFSNSKRLFSLLGCATHKSRIVTPQIIVPLSRSNQLILRELKESDAVPLFSTIDSNRAHLREWLPWVDSTIQLEDSKKFIATSTKQNQEGTALVLGMFDNGKLLGTTSFVSINQIKKTSELGYWVCKSSQGKGLVTASCRALIDYGFDKLLLRKVVVKCVTENHRSMQVVKRIGFSCSEVYEEQYTRGMINILKVTHGNLTRKDWKLIKIKEEDGFRVLSSTPKSLL